MCMKETKHSDEKLFPVKCLFRVTDVRTGIPFGAFLELKYFSSKTLSIKPFKGNGK
jgi:hypothetical protein